MLGFIFRKYRDCCALTALVVNRLDRLTSAFMISPLFAERARCLVTEE